MAMKNRMKFPQQHSDYAPLAFCDVAACFSEDEWKLLHFWQKELYNNVMKDIQTALTSLGPLIATSIFSIRPKINEDQSSEDLHDVEIRSTITHSLGDAADECNGLFRSNLHCKYSQDSGERGRCDGPSTGYAAITPIASFHIKGENNLHSVEQLDFEREESISGTSTGFTALNIKEDPSLKDYEFPERDETSTCHSSGSESSTPFASTSTNEEKEAYVTDMQNCQRIESLNRPAGNAIKNKKKNLCNYLQKNIPKHYKSTLKKFKANVIRKKPEINSTQSQMCLESDTELREGGGEEKEQWQSNLHQLSNSWSPPRLPIAQPSETYDTCESMKINDNNNPCEISQVQICRPYSCIESEQPCQNNMPAGHQQVPSVKGRQTCAECGKAFSGMSSLIMHLRVHTGERPYHCTLCGKSFTQKGVLRRHQQMHAGERPYQCALCEKSFIQKYYYVRHQRTHLKT